MEITHIAHSCFSIKSNDLTFIIDPYGEGIGYKVNNLKADALLVTHDHPDHSNIDCVSGYRLLVDHPGEYEIGGAFIQGLKTYHDDKRGELRGKNTIFLIDVDDFSILHLGDLGHELSSETLEQISDVDILMVPVGDVYTIGPKVATKVISSLEPSYVIPMHYQTKDLKLGEELQGLDKFLNEMGVENTSKKDKLKVSRVGDLPEDTEVVVLKMTA